MSQAVTVAIFYTKNNAFFKVRNVIFYLNIKNTESTCEQRHWAVPDFRFPTRHFPAKRGKLSPLEHRGHSRILVSTA